MGHLSPVQSHVYVNDDVDVDVITTTNFKYTKNTNTTKNVCMHLCDVSAFEMRKNTVFVTIFLFNLISLKFHTFIPMNLNYFILSL